MTHIVITQHSSFYAAFFAIFLFYRITLYLHIRYCERSEVIFKIASADSFLATLAITM